jgi:hypothetical protein
MPSSKLNDSAALKLSSRNWFALFQAYGFVVDMISNNSVEALGDSLSYGHCIDYFLQF